MQTPTKFRQLKYIASSLFFVSALTITLVFSRTVTADPRLIGQQAQSPPWTWAIGKLSVSGQKREGKHKRFHTENCSATLVKQPGKANVKLIVSAWHCFEYYNDLTYPIVFHLTTKQGKKLSKKARLLSSGGDMQGDWAILELLKPIAAEQVRALSLQPESIDSKDVSLAGYSRDHGLGQGGKHLSYHPNCQILARQGSVWQSNCIAHKGASGGAVIQITGGTAYLAGVVSAGNGEGLSYFIPASVFRNEFKRLAR